MPHVMSWIEGSVALGFMAAFPLWAMVFYKDEHVEHHPVRVYVGAALQGLIIGGLIGFVILPFRITFFVPDPSILPDPRLLEDPPTPLPKGLASLSVLPAFLLLMVVRRGLLARAPLIGRYLRAYRRAALKWQIDVSSKALARLEAIDDRKA